MVLSNLKHNPSDINQKHKLLFGVCLHLNLLNLPPHWTVQGVRQQQSGRLVSSLTTLLERIFSTKLSRKRLIWSLTRMLTYHESSCSISTPLSAEIPRPGSILLLLIKCHVPHLALVQTHTKTHALSQWGCHVSSQRYFGSGAFRPYCIIILCWSDALWLEVKPGTNLHWQSECYCTWHMGCFCSVDSG